MSDTRKTGSIARLVADRAYGFIYCPADSRDYFMHQVQLENCEFRELQEGDRVSFVVGEGVKGKPEAQEIRLEHHDMPPGQQTREQLGMPSVAETTKANKAPAKPPRRSR